jgi:hypothetical protein
VAVEPLFQLDVAGYNSLNGIAAGTLEMWGPQLEQASTAGPLIPTSGTPATGSGGIATFTTSNLPVGTEALVATYSGDANDTSATSNTVAETVNKASSITPATE